MLLLAINGSIILYALIYLVIAALIFYVVIWYLDWVGVPAPFNKIIKALVGLVVIIFLINLLLSFIGKQFIEI